MKKTNFIFLVATVVASLIFALGMCMCLLPQWNAFAPGAILTSLGLIALIVIALAHWNQSGRPLPRMNWKKVGKIGYCALSLLVLGGGMAMIMCFEGMFIGGMILGVAGIALLLGWIPMFNGLK